MQTLDLKRIMTTANLKPSHVGPRLFPDNRDPAGALRRVMRGEMFLSSEQVAKLSELLNVPIGLLYDDASWHMKAPAGRRNIINFRAYDYFAELNTKTMETTISRNGEVFFEKVLTHEKSIGLQEYLSQLTDLIIKYK
jgi:hypothetical protein